jgi:hypothetical protein
MTWPEFEGMTLAQFEALEDRRMISVRYQRYNAGLLAAILCNSHAGTDAEPVEAWDFIPGFQRNGDEVEAAKLRRSVRHGIRVAFGSMRNKTVEEVRQDARGMIERMAAAGTDDAEALVREVFEEVIQQPWE